MLLNCSGSMVRKENLSCAVLPMIPGSVPERVKTNKKSVEVILAQCLTRRNAEARGRIPDEARAELPRNLFLLEHSVFCGLLLKRIIEIELKLLVHRESRCRVHDGCKDQAGRHRIGRTDARLNCFDEARGLITWPARSFTPVTKTLYRVSSCLGLGDERNMRRIIKMREEISDMNGFEFGPYRKLKMLPVQARVKSMLSLNSSSTWLLSFANCCHEPRRGRILHGKLKIEFAPSMNPCSSSRMSVGAVLIASVSGSYTKLRNSSRTAIIL